MKKKLLFVIDMLCGGGAEKILADIVKYLDKDKFEITVLSVFDGGKYVEDIKKYANYKYIFSQYNQIDLLNRISNSIKYRIARFMLRNMNPSILYKKAINEKYDCEISFLEGYSASIISGSTNKDSYKIAWIHTDLVKNPWSKNYYKYQSEKEIYSKFNKIICVSQDIKESFIRKYKTQSDVEVIYNPIDEKTILKKSKEPINDMIYTKNRFVCCAIGRLEKTKSYDMLLNVHTKLIQNGVNHELWILGEGTERSKLESIIKKNKIDSSVKLLGFRDNPYKYLSRSDLFVCSSNTEGYSTAAIEATILEIPTVTTLCPGMKEIFGESKYGLIVKNDEDNLYKGIYNMINNKSLYSQYSIKTKQNKQNFKIDKSIKNIEDMLLKLTQTQE